MTPSRRATPAAVWWFLHCLFAAVMLLAGAGSHAGAADPESFEGKLSGR